MRKLINFIKKIFLKKERQIILNRIQTPDGTILTSYFTHDYKTYVDKNGEEYMVDGGIDYLRRNKNVIPYKELSIYSDDSFEKIRENFYWGTYGKSGTDPLTYVALKDMTTDHIEACLRTQTQIKGGTVEYLFKKELEFRNNNGI